MKKIVVIFGSGNTLFFVLCGCFLLVFSAVSEQKVLSYGYRFPISDATHFERVFLDNKFEKERIDVIENGIRRTLFERYAGDNLVIRPVDVIDNSQVVLIQELYESPDSPDFFIKLYTKHDNRWTEIFAEYSETEPQFFDTDNDGIDEVFVSNDIYGLGTNFSLCWTRHNIKLPHRKVNGDSLKANKEKENQLGQTPLIYRWH